MATIDPASLPHVIEPSVVSALGERLIEVGNMITTAFSGASSRWRELRGFFDVRGAEGIHSVLDRPGADATAFAESLFAARNTMWDAATLALPDLVTRRAELATRITDVNAASSAADSAWASADSAYWSTRRLDLDEDAMERAAGSRRAAARDVTAATDAADALRDDIARFRRDLESAEDLIASGLNGIRGGTEVYGAWGERVGVAQMYWGFLDSPYPGAPSALSTTLGLAGHLEASLSNAVASRISWLASADPASVRAWVGAHPDFASAVGFVEPDRAARLWLQLSADSLPGVSADGVPVEWVSGPLAQLFLLAPLAIGNLNGVPAAQRNVFTREGLAQLVADDSVDDDTRDKLQSLSRMLSLNTEVTLLSVFLDADGAPRASVAWGDVDAADQITTVSHGISTDLGSLQGWSRSARDIKDALDSQLAYTGGAGIDTAMVLFMEWDSGNPVTVFGIERPDSGAARLSNLLQGFEQTNPAAQRNLVLHSLGTTMGGQAIADNPGLVDNAWFFGSAGLSPEAPASIASQISGGDITVHATHATADKIAWAGRSSALGSDHPVDPRTVAGVSEFGSDGGFVAGYGTTGAAGDQTEGHNAQESDEILFWGIDEWRTTPDGSPVPVFDTVSTGYLDPTAQSFLQLVVDLADAAEVTR